MKSARHTNMVSTWGEVCRPERTATARIRPPCTYTAAQSCQTIAESAEETLWVSESNRMHSNWSSCQSQAVYNAIRRIRSQLSSADSDPVRSLARPPLRDTQVLLHNIT